MDRLKEIKDKYEMNGVESLTSEEIEYVESEFKRSLEKGIDLELEKIITEYYLKNDNLDKIIDICDFEFKNGYEFNCNFIIRDYIKNKDVTKLEGLDYPFIHSYLGSYYYQYSHRNDSYKFKAIEHLNRGLKQGSYYCSERLLIYYLKNHNEKNPTKEDFEKAIHFANLCLRTNQKISKSIIESCIENSLFSMIEHSESLTKEERDSLNNDILQSKELLYCKAKFYWNRYEKGNFKDDFDLCIYWCELSANKGYEKACEFLGNIYSDSWNHNGFEDYKKALYYYEKGNFEYGVSWIIRKFIEEKRFDELQISSIESFLVAAKIFKEKKEYEKAKELYEKAAEQGNSEALYSLGFMYNDGKGVQQDYKKAIEYYEKAAEQGNSEALYSLGFMYKNGEGVQQDYKKAIEYYEKAAEQGNSKALYSLGFMYNDGKGVQQDYKKAIEYYEKAAEQGNSEALYSLGFMYKKGKGVQQDYKKAIEYYEKAAEQGINAAKKVIMKYKYLNDEKVQYDELFFLEKNDHEGDLYYEKIKKMINEGGEIISVKSLTDLAQIQIPRDGQDNNKIKDYMIKLILDFLNEKGDNTIINIRQTKSLNCNVAADFYTVFDLKKIVSIYKKVLDGIDLNQNQEDIFMQLYIKLGLMISYDYDAVEKHKKEKASTSTNLMTLLNKKGVCKGYAVILKNILDIVGIKSNILISKASDGDIRHAFNQVEINGKWYYCDMTWDVKHMKKGKVLYCLKSKKRFISSVIGQIYHENESSLFEHEANDDYPNAQRLFKKNRFKLFLKGFNLPLNQLIEPAGIKEDGGRSR